MEEVKRLALKIRFVQFEACCLNKPGRRRLIECDDLAHF